MIALIIVEPVVSLLHGGDELYYFLVGGALSVPRFLFLGLIIGYLYEKSNVSSKAPKAVTAQLDSTKRNN